jgi:hypothetical protein
MPIEHSYRVLAHEIRVVAPRTHSAFLHRFLAQFQADVGADAHRYEVREEPDADKPWVLVVDDRALQRGRTPNRVLELALWDVSRKAIASDHGCLALHAAAASWQGSGIVFPAPPESGKSTLVAGLTRAGCAYLTDEAALIDVETRMLRPFPRSLWLTRPSLEAVFPGRADPRWSTGREFHVRPADLRPRAVGRTCRVSHVIVPRFEAGSGTSLEPIGRADAVMIMAENAFHLDRLGGSGIELIADVAERAMCYRLAFGDLPEAISAVLRVLRKGPAARRR